MTHPLVDQLRFTRSEWLRGFAGVSEEDGSRHFARMNCISWNVGHLAWQEQRYWLHRAQGRLPFPQLVEMYASGAPMSTPSLREMLDIWKRVTADADLYLVTCTTESLQAELLIDGKAVGQTVGSGMRRMTYHYWYHIGEIQAIRQMLGQGDLPEYVGEIELEATYRPE
ncbi:MAG: DinB family protein [Candidatus Limnocylindria bacterium]